MVERVKASCNGPRMRDDMQLLETASPVQGAEDPVPGSMNTYRSSPSFTYIAKVYTDKVSKGGYKLLKASLQRLFRSCLEGNDFCRFFILFISSLYIDQTLHPLL